MGPLTSNLIRDTRRNITYNVRTPKKLTPDERILAVRLYLRHIKPKDRPKPNTTCTFICPVGILGMGADR